MAIHGGGRERRVCDCKLEVKAERGVVSLIDDIGVEGRFVTGVVSWLLSVMRCECGGFPGIHAFFLHWPRCRTSSPAPDCYVGTGVWGYV